MSFLDSDPSSSILGESWTELRHSTKEIIMHTPNTPVIDAVQTAAGWDIYHDDEYLGFFALMENSRTLKLDRPGVEYHEFPFRGFGRLS